MKKIITIFILSALLSGCINGNDNIKEDCPDFSSLSDRLLCGESDCGSFIVVGDNGVGKVGKYTLFPGDYDYQAGGGYSGIARAPCEKGQNPGENVNYYYCKGMYTVITETGSSGNVLSSKKYWVTLVVQDKKIIDSICEG